MKKVFYKRGDLIANAPTTYSTPDDIFETDDSYFYNSFKYNRINFTPLTESERVLNGTFDNTSHWTLTDNGNGSGTTWVIVGGKASRASSGGSNDWILQPNLLIVGKTYQVTFDLVATAGHVIVNSQASAQQFTTTDTHTDTFVASITTFQFMASDTFRGSIDNVSLKEIKTNQIPSLYFNSVTGSNVVSEHNERYNFNRDDDFAISFYMEPTSLTENSPTLAAVNVGDTLQGGIIFYLDGNGGGLIAALSDHH